MDIFESIEDEDLKQNLLEIERAECENHIPFLHYFVNLESKFQKIKLGHFGFTLPSFSQTFSNTYSYGWELLKSTNASQESLHSHFDSHGNIVYNIYTPSDKDLERPLNPWELRLTQHSSELSHLLVFPFPADIDFEHLNIRLVDNKICVGPKKNRLKMKNFQNSSHSKSNVVNFKRKHKRSGSQMEIPRFGSDFDFEAYKTEDDFSFPIEIFDFNSEWSKKNQKTGSQVNNVIFFILFKL